MGWSTIHLNLIILLSNVSRNSLPSSRVSKTANALGFHCRCDVYYCKANTCLRELIAIFKDMECSVNDKLVHLNVYQRLLRKRQEKWQQNRKKKQNLLFFEALSVL